MDNSNSAISLPTAQKLDGAKDYLTWKANMTLLMKSARLWAYIDVRRCLTFPAKVEWDHPVSEELEAWEKWEANDCRAQLAISINIIDADSKSIINERNTALAMWEALEQRYEEKGYDDKYNAIVDYTVTKYETYNDLDAYIAAFRTKVDQVRQLKLHPDSVFWDPVLFINGLGTAFPIWAEHQRSATRNNKTPATVDDLVADISREVHLQQSSLSSSDDSGMYCCRAKSKRSSLTAMANKIRSDNSAAVLASWSPEDSKISDNKPTEFEFDQGISASQVTSTRMQVAARPFPTVSTTLGRRPDATTGCANPEHKPHESWPDEDTGNVRVLSCERLCQYCDQTKPWPTAAALRKHVSTHLINFDVIRECRGGYPITAYNTMMRNGITPPIRNLSSKEEEEVPVQTTSRRPYDSNSAVSNPRNVFGARVAKSTPTKSRKPLCKKACW